MLHKQIAVAFPTLLGVFRAPAEAAVNAELRSLCLQREATEPDTPYANVGGWHSKQDFLDSPQACVRALRGWIVEAVNHMITATLDQMKSSGINRGFGGQLSLYGWANVSRKGNYHALHNHPGSCWAGVYYVDPGNPPDARFPKSGVIDLHDPRPFTEMTQVPGDPYGQKYSIRPEAGMMLLFPGFLYHFVHPYQGDGERVSIAFNVKAEPAASPPPPGQSAS